MPLYCSGASICHQYCEGPFMASASLYGVWGPIYCEGPDLRIDAYDYGSTIPQSPFSMYKGTNTLLLQSNLHTITNKWFKYIKMLAITVNQTRVMNSTRYIN
jgi:hypothetical protein